MIQSFKNDETRKVSDGEVSKKLPRDMQNVALRKLRMIAAAVKLDDLRSPPGNRLEALKGNREGQHSIRINDKYRICFIWSENHASDVEIVDYH